MKIGIFALFILCTLGTRMNAEVILVEPQGEYEKIANNNEESFELFQILMGDIKGNKAEAALKAEKNLGAQIPPTILELGNYYLSQGDFEKAALYHRLSMFRAIIDIRASNDASLDDVPSLFYSSINKTVSHLTKKDRKTYVENLKRITKKIIALDKHAPRNYDIRWASLHSIKAFTNGPLNYPDDEGLKKIIEQEREEYIKTAKKDGLW
jgi:hypothetical protein